jgi:ABC-2 type transport system permease protein
MPLLRAELTKALSLRSIQATLLAALIVCPALAFASGLVFRPDSPSAALFPIESHGFEVAGFGQPLVILYAALVAGSEYVGGQLRSTLLGTPQRGRVLTAKLIVITVPTALVGLIATGTAVLVKHAALGEHGLAVSQFTAGMGWNLIGVAINYTLVAVIAAGITLVARSVIIPVLVLLPLVLGLTISLLGILPALKYLPDLAGIQLLTGYPGIGLLAPLPGGLVMAGWAVLLGVIAWLAFRVRDVA